MQQQAPDTLPPQSAFSWQAQPAQHDTQRLRQALAPSASQALPAVDRLEAAFGALRGRGIVARHDYSCCSTCGSAEIRDEMAAAMRAGEPADGFAFYHWQDTEDAPATGRLALSFGSRLGGPLGTAEIGVVVLQALRDAGLPVDWDESARSRMTVVLAAS
jgi:hypothetical protein